MTAEQKQLLTKDLCARLPYGVKSVYMKYGRHGDKFKEIDSITGINGEMFITSRGEEINLREDIEAEVFKPILFPLEAIDKEIEIGGEKVCVNNLILNNTRFMVSATHFTCSTSIYRALEIDEMNFILDTFNRYHIDYRNLISQGLAISVFDLPENPYR